MFSRSQKLLLTQIENWQLTRSLSLSIVIATFFFSLISGATIIHKGEQERRSQQRDDLIAIADEYSVAIQHDVEQTLSLTYALANLVEEYQGFIPNLKTVAKDLFPFYQGAGSLALLSEGIAVSEMIGTKVNSALNDIKVNQQEIACSQSTLDLADSRLLDEHNYPELSLTTIGVSTTGIAKIATAQNKAGQTSLASPIGLGCLPIFLEEKTNQSSFWGFTSVLIDYSFLLQNLDWQGLTQEGVAYQLEIDASEDDPGQIVVDSFRTTAVDPVVKSFMIAGETWTLRLSPVNGWQQQDSLRRAYLIVVLSSLLLAALVKIYLDSKLNFQELEKITYIDFLTNLPNHRFLKYRLEQIVGNHLQKDQNIVLCHLNLDDFREINQQFGRRIGDYLLVRIAKRLQKFLRVEDVVVRLEGDEFGIVLQNIQDCEEAEKILERIMDAVSNPINLEGSTIVMSLSIGATIYPQHNVEINNPHQDISCQNSYLIQMLLNQAKQSLLQTKQQKGSYLFFKDLCQFNSNYCSDTECVGIESNQQN